MLSGVNGASPWAADSSESALLPGRRLLLGSTLLGWLLIGSFPMVFVLMRVSASCA